MGRTHGDSPDIKCLRRLLTPRCDGTYLVPQQIIDEWKDTANGGRQNVLKLWEQSSHDKAWSPNFESMPLIYILSSIDQN